MVIKKVNRSPGSWNGSREPREEAPTRRTGSKNKATQRDQKRNLEIETLGSNPTSDFLLTHHPASLLSPRPPPYCPLHTLLS